MKVTFIISLVILSISANIYSQENVISIKAKNVRLEDLFREIENQSDYSFFFNAQYPELINEISIKISSSDIKDILNELLSETTLDYKILENNFIVIVPKEIEGGISISGKITDINGNPLTCVHVVEKGTVKGVITNIQGNYMINVESEDVILKYSCLGHISEEVKVGNQKVINIILKQDTYGLEELVITGFGIQRKSDVTGSVVSVAGDRLCKVPVSGIDQAMQGRAAGVLISSENGSPGSDIVVRVRGISSINGAPPLYVVDGVPMPSDAIGALNPNDIKSIEVLKDASSSAIYGASGGNGVILISTKKGRQGALVAELDYYFGIQNPHERMDMLNSQEYFQVYSEIAPPQHYWPADTFNYFPDVDYQDELFRNAPIHRINFSVSGGNDLSTYWFSASYFMQDGVIPKSDYRRVTLRLNSDHKLGKRFLLGQNISVINETYKGFLSWQFNHAYNSPIAQAINMHPFVRPYKFDGSWSTSPISGIINPFFTVDIMDRDIPEYRVLGDINLTAEIFKNLKYKTVFGGDINFRWTREFTPAFYYNSVYNNDEPYIHRESARNYTWNWQHTLNYSVELNKHFMSFMIGMDAGYYLNEDISATGYNLIHEMREMHYFDATLSDDNILNGSGEEVAQGAYFGRFMYNFDNRYLITSNIRKDYSSKFGPGKRAGFFPSLSIGWKFSEEDLFKNLSFLSFGKIRMGWGQTGNSNLRPYVPYAVVKSEQVYSYPLDNTEIFVGAAPHGIANKEIAWEALEDINIGMDVTLLDNKLSFVIDYFRKYNRGMIIEVPVPDLSGTFQRNSDWEGGPTQFVNNVGNVRNNGIEVTLGYNNPYGNFKQSVDFSFSYVKNIVGNINGNVIVGGNAYTFRNLNYTAEGYPMGSLYGYVTDGLFRPEDAVWMDSTWLVINQPYYTNDEGEIVYAQPDAQPGDIRFKDLNNDGKINSSDRTIIGNPHPKYIIGINYQCEYKAFDFSMFWQGEFGHEYFRVNKVWLYNSNGMTNWHRDVLDRYTEDNTDASLFRLDFYNTNRNNRVSDWYVEPAGYLRLKSIQLGYTLPVAICKPMGIKRCRVYIGARDLLTFTKYGGLDPEIASNETQDPLQEGIDVSTYPRPRVFTFGFNAGF